MNTTKKERNDKQTNKRRRQHQQQRHQRQYLQQHTTMKKASPTPKPPAIRMTQRASSHVESDSPAAEDAVAATEPPPPLQEDECAICCYLLPLKQNERVYQPCCGTTLCQGCIIAQERVRVIGENVNVPLKGSKEEEREFKMIYFSESTPITGSKEEERSELGSLCPFCNAKNVSENDTTELLKRLWERIDEYNDPEAMIMLGSYYFEGQKGLSKNQKKAEDLYQQAYEFGDAKAAAHLAHMYSDSDQFPEQAQMIKYLEEGARRGSVACLNSLSRHAFESGNHAAAIRGFTYAARSGDDTSLQNLLVYIRTPGVISTGVGMAVFKDDLATTLRAHKAANDERTSVPRDYSKGYHDWIAKWNAQVEN